MDAKTSRDIEASYDRVAREYAEHLYDELKGKPLDRQLLDRFAERLRSAGPVCDLGCGPGQIARYLRDRGVETHGIDLSPGMVAEARRLNPDIPFSQGDMLALDSKDGTWAGIAAFYAIVHLLLEEIPRAFAEMKRVLRPGGLLLLAFHVGEEIVHRDELWGQEVALDFRFFLPEDIEAALRSAGFEIEEVHIREPYPEVEHPSRRAYILARKPKL
jgi:SAM-dependent methyltransferase